METNLTTDVESNQPPEGPEPDMGAVYILLGCLAVSGLVVFGVLLYCVSYCWKKKCWDLRRTSPTIRISGSIDDGYVSLKHSRMMNGKINGQLSVEDSSHNSVSTKETTFEYGSKYQLHTQDKLTTNKTSSDFDSLDEEAERRSVLHYDIGYNKNNVTCFRGTLTFALRYDHIHRVLMVHIIRANHLPKKDRSNICNPYIKIYLCPERRIHNKTNIYKKALDPEFNEMFSFDCPYSDLSHRMLQFTLYDFDRFKRHDLIGSLIMRDLFEKSDLYTWTEYTMQIIADVEKDDFGDLLLYLSYDDADSKLITCVAKAYNLRPMDITGASDPYVKIVHLIGRKRLKTKKTTIKRANLHPVYNEVLTFDFNDNMVENSTLLIKVMDWDRIGRDDLLGCCILGAESPTIEGREQWRQCISSRKKSVGMWHSLLPDVPKVFSDISK